MAVPEPPVQLSAVSLRLTDEVGDTVLGWAAAGDMALDAALDQHVAAARAALAACEPGEPSSAWRAGLAAHQATRAEGARPHHARRSGAPAGPEAVRGPGAASPVRHGIACPDAPFADNPWRAEASPPLQMLLHYACGFIEAAVRADWWPGQNAAATGAADFESVRLAAVCRLVRQAEAVATLPPDLR